MSPSIIPHAHTVTVSLCPLLSISLLLVQTHIISKYLTPLPEDFQDSWSSQMSSLECYMKPSWSASTLIFLKFFFFCFQYSSICFNGFYHKQNSPLDYFTISHDSPPCNVLPSLINSFFKTQFKWHRYFLFLVTLNLFCDHSLLIPPQML